MELFTWGLLWLLKLIRYICLSGVYRKEIGLHPQNGRLFWSKGHFTHESRGVTMKLWQPKRKCPKAIPRHFQNHLVWSQSLKCSVKSYVAGPSTKCYFNKLLFMRALTPWLYRINQWLWAFGVKWSPHFVLGLPPRDGFLKIVQVTMKHDSFDAT